VNYALTPSDRKALEEGCYYDQEQATKATTFIERYYVPSTSGKPIRLTNWQRELVERLYGWRTRTGHRRHRKLILSTAKKAGKNTIQAGCLLLELLGGVQPSPFVVSASTTRENAGQLYRELSYAIRANPKLAKLCKCLDSTKEVRAKSKAARYKAFSADAGSAEGENISALVVDELHAHKSDALYRSLEHATIARPDGLTCIISTAGHDQSSLWFDLFKYAQGVQAGDIVDTSLLAMIFTAPDDADIEDPKVWKLANPSLDCPGCFTSEDFRKDLERAKAGGTSDLLSFRRYRLNQWTRADDSFIDPVKFDQCQAPMTDEQLKPYPLYVGADLSQTTDACSVSMVWALGERKFYARSHSWVCEEGVRRREESNLPKYRVFEAQGDMTITKGTVNDYRAIKAYLQGLRQRFNLKELVFDQYNAMEMAAELYADGIPVFRQPQNHKHYTPACKDLEVAITEVRLKHDGNKLLRWALSNTRLDYDAYGNCKPSRDKSTDKIDPAVALLMAFGRATSETIIGQRESPYQHRGLMIL
jgi:phage terminase large subunit-like protein